MLKLQSISADSGFTISISGESPRLSAALENEVERLWLLEQSRRGVAIFNGRIFSASTVSPEGITGCVVEYRQLIAQRACPDLFSVLQVRPVAVSGLLECAEGIVFGRRAASLTQDAGLWELVPSGGIEVGTEHSMEIDYISQILAELSEEAGITARALASISPFCLIEDTDSHVFDIGIAMKSSLSNDEILENHRNLATKEYEQLRIIPRAEVDTAIQKESLQLVNVSTALMQEFARSHASH